MASIVSQDDTLVPHSVDEDRAFGTHGRVVIAIWRIETRPSAAVELGSLIVESVTKHRGAIDLLQIIEDAARAPSAMARQALAKMHGERAATIRRSALVFSKPGFAGAAVRAVMTGVAMLNPPKFEHQLFGNVLEAIAWLEDDPSKTGPRSTRAFRQAVAELRALQQLPPGTSEGGTSRGPRR